VHSIPSLPTQASTTGPIITWLEGEQTHTARWQSESRLSPPKKVLVVDDTLTADRAYRMACEGIGLLWRGDFQNARQLLDAMARRIDKPKKPKRISKTQEAKRQSAQDGSTPDSIGAVFHAYRLAQSQRSRTLAQLLIPIGPHHQIQLARAPKTGLAGEEAFGPMSEDYVIPLREMLGVVGAHEWRKKGLVIDTLKTDEERRIYPHYGVFSPIRGEYLDLISKAKLPQALEAHSRAFDIGTGTGVLAAILAVRGIEEIVASEIDPRALRCAQDNIQQLGYAEKIQLVETNLFPDGKASLIVCNPPWIPARPSSSLERAIYDPDSQMLRGFLNGLVTHLQSTGEGWLILSDLAEHLGLRSRAQLLTWIAEAGLVVLAQESIKPRHSKAADKSDALYAARSAEITTLWRLGRANPD